MSRYPRFRYSIDLPSYLETIAFGMSSKDSPTVIAITNIKKCAEATEDALRSMVEGAENGHTVAIEKAVELVKATVQLVSSSSCSMLTS